MRLRRLLGAFVFVIAACGGGDADETSPSPPTSPGTASEQPAADDADGPTPIEPELVGAVEISSTARDAAERLVVSLGDDAGVAVLLALDRGYSAFQVLGAAGADELDAQGRIEDVEPEGAPVHGFSDEYALGRPPAGEGPMLLRAPPDHGDPDIWVRVGTPRDLLEVAEERARAMGRTDDAAGVVALVLVLAEAGYDLEQITEALLQPEIVGMASIETDWEDLDGNSRDADCTLLVDVATRTPVIPANRPATTECDEVRDRLGIEARLHTDAVLVGGPIIDAPTVASVRLNRFRIDARPDIPRVGGSGAIAREVILGDEEHCVDHKVSGLRVYFSSETAEVDEAGVIRAEGRFLYNVAADLFVLIGEECPGANVRFGRGEGSWSGTFDTRSLEAELELVFPGGLGTNVVRTDG